MLSDRDRLALHDLRDNARFAQALLEGVSEAAFEADRKTFYAVTRCLEIVSEAARRLSPALLERHPALPWREMMGAGNVYRHDYQNVAPEFVWRTVQGSLQALLALRKRSFPALKPYRSPALASAPW